MKSLIAIATLAVTTTTCPVPGDEPPIDHSSPQSVAKEFQRAFAAHNWERGFRCMTLGKQQSSAAMAMFPAIVVMAANKDEQTDASLERMLAKHGLTVDDASGRISEMTDTRTLATVFGDLMTWVADNHQPVDGKRLPVLERIAAGTYTNFEIDGDVAFADLQREGKKPSRPQFTRIDGKWYLGRVDEDVFESLKGESPVAP